MSISLRAVLPLGLVALSLVAGVRGASAQGQVWPTFALTRVADGVAVSSAALVRPDQWVVAVVRPGCDPCRAVVRRLASAGAGVEPGRVAVVLSGLGAAEATAVRADAPGLPESAWYLDANGAAVEPLAARNAPVLVGVQRDRIAWTLRGAMFSDAQWQGVVVPWLR